MPANRIDVRLIWGLLLLLAAAFLAWQGQKTLPGDNFDRIHNNSYARALRAYHGEPAVLSKQERMWQSLGYFAAGGMTGIAGAGLLLLALIDFAARREDPDSWSMLDAKQEPAERRFPPGAHPVGMVILGLIGSEIGAILVGLLVIIGLYFAADPLFVMIGFIPYAVSLSAWLLIIPPYVLCSVFAGLIMCRHHVMSVFLPTMEPKDSELYGRVARLAWEAGLAKPPQVGVYASDAPNALATGPGRDSSLILFSSALLEHFTEEEVDAVAAHEIGHIVNGDMVAMTVVNSIQNGMSWMMLFYKLRMLVRRLIFFITEVGAMALSRAREYRADAVAAELTSPGAIIAALQRLDGQSSPLPDARRGYAPLMFSTLLSTHPPIKNRIAAVEQRRLEVTVRATVEPVGDTTMG